MANNYDQILTLANKNNMGLSNTIKRDYGIPLDYSSVQASLDDAVIYAATSTLAYVGQPIAVGGTLYIIDSVAHGEHSVTVDGETTTYSNYLKEVGSKPEGDGNSIVVAPDGTVSMKGFETADNAFLPRVAVSTDASGNETGRTLEWVPVSAVVEADGNTRTVIDIENSSIIVNRTYDQGTDTYTYTLDVEFPAPPEYSVVKTENDDGSVTYQLTKDDVVVGEDIVIPAPYDDSALDGRVEQVEAGVAANTEYLEKVKRFFDGAAEDNGDLTQALDTLKEIQTFINTDGETAQSLLTAINANAEDIQANADAIAELKGDSANSIQGIVAAAVNTYKQGADATHASINERIDELVEDAATKDDVNKALGEKADKTDLANYYTTTETFTKDEVRELIAGITGAEEGDTTTTVAAIKSQLDEHAAANAASFEAIDGAQTAQNTNIANNAAEIQKILDPATGIYAKATADAATEAQRLIDVLANGAVATNTQNIAGINESLGTVNTDLSALTGRVGAVETKADNTAKGLADEIAAREQLAGVVEQHATDITAVTGTANANATEIASIKENYATNTSVESSINAAKTELTGKITENTNAITAEAERAAAAEEALSGRITKNSEDIQQINTQVAAIDEAYKSADSNILARLAKTADTFTAENTVDDAIKAVSGTLTSVSGTVSANTETINKNAADIATNTASIAANTEYLDKVKRFFDDAAEDSSESLNDALDTLKDIQAFINTDGTTAAKMAEDIAANKTGVAKNAADILTIQSIVGNEGSLTKRVAANEVAIAGLTDVVVNGDDANAKLRTDITSLQQLTTDASKGNAKLRTDLDAVTGTVTDLSTTLGTTTATADSAKSTAEAAKAIADQNKIDIASLVESTKDCLKSTDSFILYGGSATVTA